MIWNSFYQYRWAIAAVVLCVLGLSIPLVQQLQTDPSNQAVLEHDEAYDQNEFFRQTFGSDDSVVIGIGNTQILSKPILNWIKTLSWQLKENNSVLSTESIIDIPRIESKLFHVSSEVISDRYFSGEESLEDFKQQLKVNSTFANYLISQDQTFSVIVANLKSPLESARRKAVLQEIESWLKAFPPPSGKIYLSGTATEQDRFIEKIQHDHELFVPITFILIMVTLFLLNGHLSALIYPASVILTTLLTTQALMALADIPLNMMTTLVSPVILIVSVSDVVHLQSHAKHLGLQQRGGPLLRAVFRSLAVPCLLTTLTTIAGFLSLTFSRIPAVREFGGLAALGTGLALFWTFCLAPLFMTFHVKSDLTQAHISWNNAAARLSRFSVKYRTIILIVGFVALSLGIWGIRSVRVETDILGSFKSEDPFRQDTQMFHEKLGGVYPLELVLHSPGFSSFSNPEELKKVEQLKQSLLNVPGISDVRYLTDIIEVVDKGIRKKKAIHGELPPGDYLNRYLIEMSKKDPQQVNRFADKNYEWTRMSAFLTLSSTAAVMNIAEQIQQSAREILPEGWSLFIAGQTYLLARMSQRLVAAEIQSLLIAMGIIGILLVLWTKSLKMGLVSLLVNLIPLLIVLGSMPLLNIKLNTATAMIGAVAVGLIVDNTIHVLFRFRQGNPRFAENGQAIEHVMNYCAQPMISATLVLIVGFSATLMGSIKPTIQFGMLMILMTFAALLSNLFILPALLAGNGRRS